MAEERHCSECGGKLPADAPQGLCPQCLMKLGLPTGAEADKKDSPDDKRAIPTSATPPGGFVPPEPAELARQFPQLEILELLGQGGMGAVYKARQKQLDRLVALKILPPEVGQTEAFAERFTREARSMAMLNHPHIVTVHDFGHTEEGLYYFVMEFVDGTDLRRVIQAGELRPDEALVIVPQICEALQYAHEEGIVHRDIKPENVLLDKKGRVKIADFGLARLLDRPATAYTLTQAGQRMGTPHYMAPEQIEHPHEVDHRADIYSLGVVFYEMLTGELPLGRFAPPSQKVQVDVRLDEIVLHTLEKEPERRYQHASEVKTDVETIAAEAKPAAVYAPKTPTTRRFSRAAIVGACWAPFFFLLLVPAVLFVMPVYRFTGPDGGPTPRTGVGFLPLVITIPFLLLGLTALFGTTILGIVGITHIRQSAGRLYGMGLALFDTLLFPLLLLNIAILAVFLLAGMGISEAVILTLIICGLLDFFIIRWAWRKANAGLEPLQRQATPVEDDEKAAIRQQVRGPAIALLIAGIITLASGPITGLWILVEYRLVDSWEVGDWRLGTTVLTIWLIAQAVAITIAALVIAAALNMKRLKSRGLALTAAILAMIPLTLSWPLTLPITIWVLSILTRPEVKAAFPRKKRVVDLSRQGKWNAFCIAALPISLVGIFFSIREMDPGEDVAVRIIWALSIAISVVFAGIGLWQHSKYQGMKGKGLGIAALIVALAALVGFVVTIYYPVGW